MAIGSSLPPVERRVLRHEVLLGLRSGILAGEIVPGTRLLEVPLAAELGVSRGPVREALRQLEQEGLVEFFPHRGAVVVGVADAEMATIYGIRGLLEERAFAKACRVITDDELDHLGETVEKMVQASEAGDVAAVTEHDMYFHGRVVELSGFQYLRRLWTSIEGWSACAPPTTWTPAAAGESTECTGCPRPAVGRASRTRRRAPQPASGHGGEGSPDPHHAGNGAPPRRGRRVIARTEVLVLTHRLTRQRLFGTGSNTTRDSVVVRLEDVDGRIGWGETYLVPGAVEAARSMTDGWAGQDPDAVAASMAATPGLHRWALGGVSMALDDLRARRRGVPVSALYGERLRGRVRAYASSRGYVDGQTPEAAWADEAAATWDQGFRAMKLRIGRYPVDDEIAGSSAWSPAVRR